MDSTEEVNGQSEMPSIINEDNQRVDDLMGLVVSGENEAFDLYNNYAIRTGFSVRKSKKRYNKGTILRQREYRCSKAGYTFDDKDYSTMQRNKLKTRFGCEAMIRFSINDEGWTVSKFTSTHNHELALPSEAHLLRSNRKLTSSKTNVIDSMVEAGISVTDTYSYMSKEVGGNELLGFTKKDCYNHVNQQKNNQIEAGDAQSLINHFKKCQADDGMFFHTVQIDQQKRMTNFFWRDGRSRVDYDSFGDVVVFDTTYRTNKYNLICAPFVGVNHHWQNVMFGCAFLSNEKTESFIWLFESFLESMGGKAPTTIFTDQDQAMSNAIGVVFPTSRHRLCIWHIAKNAPSHLGTLNSNSEFRHLFYKILHRCESEEEFDKIWAEMCESFEEVRTHKWLNTLYTIRQKWCKGLNKDAFSAGILSSQRSESTNRVLNKISSKTTTLTNFVHRFEGIVGDWRSSEAEEDFRCKQGTPSCVVKYSGLLNHAASIYTCVMYKQFEKEFLNAVGTVSTQVSCDNNICIYEVKNEDDSTRYSKIWTVHFNTSPMSVKCTCKKFESKGLVCRHILRVLNINNVTKIPEDCISCRWTKDARKRLYERGQGVVNSIGIPEIDSMFRNEMMRRAYNMVTRSQSNEISRRLCSDGLDKLTAEIENSLSTLDSEKPQSGEDRIANFPEKKQSVIDIDNDPEPVLNPPSVKPKGVSNSRLKGHFESGKSGKVKAKKVSSKEGNAKKKKKVVNSELEVNNPTVTHLDPRRNYEFLTSPQMVTHSFPYYQYPQPVSTNVRFQAPHSFSMPLPIPNQMSFTHMLQNINSTSDSVQVQQFYSSSVSVPPQS